MEGELELKRHNMTFDKPNRPPVLLVGNFLSASKGTRGVCEDLALGLKAAGWSVITTSARPDRLARLADFLLTIWRQRNQYQVAQVDVYSGPSFQWAELVCWALRVVRKPYMLTLHGGSLPMFAKRSGERVQHLLKSACAVTTPSAYLFQHMRAYREDLVLLPNSLEMDKYPFKHRNCPTLKLVWLRGFHDVYNPSLAIKVVALLVKEFPSVSLVMIGPDKGDGSLESAKELARRLEVLDKITFAGPVPKDTTPQWLDRGDIFLNTTRVDNTPVSVLEAMACGLCVVSTNVGGIPYLLTNECDALLVPGDDDIAMARAVRRLVTEDGLAERLSRSGRKKVEGFGWTNILPEWEKLLARVAAEART